MRQALVETRVGVLAATVRDRCRLLRAAWRETDGVGAIANDQLAMKLVSLLCRPGRIFVDIGAHIGSVTASVLRHDPSVRVVAVEAVPEKAAQLRRRFPAVTVHACAVGDTHGEVSFHVDCDRPGYSSLSGGRPEERCRLRQIRVPIRRIDDLLCSHEVDVLKIDVEGPSSRSCGAVGR